MESTAYHSQLHSSNRSSDWKEPFDAFIDYSSYETQGKTVGQSVGLNVAAPSHAASTSTCLRGFKDKDGFDMICFCLQCQDSFLAQEIHGDNSGSKSLDVASSLQSSPQSTEEITTDTSVTSPSSHASSPSRESLKRHRHGSKSSGVSKSGSNASKLRPEVLIDQLETALHGDENNSEEFKFKTSVLFKELKRLIEIESSSPRISAINETRPVEVLPSTTSCHRKRGKLPKRKGTKTQSSEKIFQCTWPACQYASSSAMDWRRHEETHWPQKRFMCLECAASPELDATKCPYCLFLYPLHLQDSSNHLLHCESAKRNGRTFARKDKLSEHLQKDHTTPPSLAMSRAAICVFEVDSGWTRQCGFCGILLDTWDERARHLVEEHFKQGADLGSWQPVFPDALKMSTWPLDTANFDTEFCKAPADSYVDTGPLSSAALLAAAQFTGWSYSKPTPIPELGFPPLPQPSQGTSELAGSAIYDYPGIMTKHMGPPTEHAPIFDPTITESTTQESISNELPPVEETRAGGPVSKGRSEKLSTLAQIKARRLRRMSSMGQDPKDQLESCLSGIVPQGNNHESATLHGQPQPSGSSAISVAGLEGPDHDLHMSLPDTYLAPGSSSLNEDRDRASESFSYDASHLMRPRFLVGDIYDQDAPAAEGSTQFSSTPPGQDVPLTRAFGETKKMKRKTMHKLSDVPRTKSDIFESRIESNEPPAPEETTIESELPASKAAEDSHIREVMNESGLRDATEAEQKKWIAYFGLHPYFHRRLELIDALDGLDSKKRIEGIVDNIQEIRDLREMQQLGNWGAEEFSANSRAHFSAADLERLKQELVEKGKQTAELGDLSNMAMPPPRPYSRSAREQPESSRGAIHRRAKVQQFSNLKRHSMFGTMHWPPFSNPLLGSLGKEGARKTETELEQRRGVVALDSITDGESSESTLSKTPTNISRLRNSILRRKRTKDTTKPAEEDEASEPIFATRYDPRTFNIPSGRSSISDEGLGWLEATVAQNPASQTGQAQGFVRSRRISNTNEHAAAPPKKSFKTLLQRIPLPLRPTRKSAQENDLSDQDRASFSFDELGAIQARRKTKMDFEVRLNSAMAGMSISENSTGPVLPAIVPAPAIEWEDRPRNFVSTDQGL